MLSRHAITEGARIRRGFPRCQQMEKIMTSTQNTDLRPRPLSSDRCNADQKGVENRRIVVALALFALLLLGEAALFMQAVRTVPDFLNYVFP